MCIRDRGRTSLFNSYIFVYTAEQFRNEVFEVAGVVKYLAIKGAPCVLKPDEIERIRKLCNQEHEVTITNSGILTGDEVCLLYTSRCV